MKLAGVGWGTRQVDLSLRPHLMQHVCDLILATYSWSEGATSWSPPQAPRLWSRMDTHSSLMHKTASYAQFRRSRQCSREGRKPAQRGHVYFQTREAFTERFGCCAQQLTVCECTKCMERLGMEPSVQVRSSLSLERCW
jgi:hypothetical protein